VPQGTIKTYDVQSRDGILLTDDEQEILIDATSVEGSGIRYLRIGQRVKFDVADEGGKKLARSLRLVTFD
jgi:2-phospho-L-lactate/phosphoenolpyruvate guanylyltransferase